MSKEDLIRGVTELLNEIQDALLKRATELRDSNMKKMDTLDEFKAFFAEGAHSGFALMHWAGSNEEEEQIAKDMKVTIRCIPLGDEYAEEGKCFITGKPSHRRVVFARSY